MEPLRFIASSAFLTNASAASPVSTGTLLIAIAITVIAMLTFSSCKPQKEKDVKAGLQEKLSREQKLAVLYRQDFMHKE